MRLSRAAAALAAAIFLRRWHRRAHGGWPVPAADAARWQDRDAAALAAWLRTDGGKAVIAALREADLRVTAHAVHTTAPAEREYRCGYAAGFRGAVAYLVTLSTQPSAIDGPEQHEEGADALLERLAP